MTAPDPRPTDERLSAWLDGELAPAQAEEVQAWLAAHPEEAARVRLWAADRDALRARLAPMADEPVPESLARAVWQTPRGALGARAASWRWAAGFLVFALGGALGSVATSHWQRTSLAGSPASTGAMAAEPAWVQRAAVAHAVYTPEQRHPVDVAVKAPSAEESRAQEEHLVRWLTRRLGFPVRLFDLRDQGFELVGGRLLPDAAGPSAQLMYQAMQAPAAGGTPPRVTVYLRKPEDRTDFAFRYERQGDVGLFYSVEGGVGYALAGSLPRERLLALAEAIYRQQPGAR